MGIELLALPLAGTESAPELIIIPEGQGPAEPQGLGQVFQPNPPLLESYSIPSADLWNTGVTKLFQAIPMWTQLRPSPGSIYFPDTQVNSSTFRSFYIYNPSSQDITIKSMTAPYGFWVSGAWTIPAGGSESYRVKFQPYSEQYFSGSVAIIPKNANANAAYVFVSGRSYK